jgi:squalene-associated FAD-dependent desaturase
LARDVPLGVRGRLRVAVVGGGWAGCAAAVTLADAGATVTLFEQAGTLGGRARRVGLDGAVVDNGQHLLLGAYRQTLALVARVHGEPGAAAQFARLPLALQPFGRPRPRGVALVAWRAPAPFHMAGALLAARGLSWIDRWRAIADFRDLVRDRGCAGGATVAERLGRLSPRAMATLWGPLCLAALNTPPERACARTFARVLREAFSASAAHSDCLIPAHDLSACFPDAAARFVCDRGGRVRLSAPVRTIDAGAEANCDAVAVHAGGATDSFDAAIVAVAPQHLRRAVGARAAAAAWREPLAMIERFAYESITTVYLRFAAPLPMQAPMLRLDDAPGQWLFQRPAPGDAPATQAGGRLYAVVISAGGPHETVDHPTLTTQVESQLRRLDPALPACTWARVIAERRATWACTPGLPRPQAGRVAPRVYLAGDYTVADFPATLEAATRSGVTAATKLIGDLGTPAMHATARPPPAPTTR